LDERDDIDDDETILEIEQFPDEPNNDNDSL
jgi:hypothetical protein